MSETERYIGKSVLELLDERVLRDEWPAAIAWLSEFCTKKGAWSLSTFGPSNEETGPNHQTICDHIRKELGEVADNPKDMFEWIDLVLLAMDGYYRYGGRDFGMDLARKHQINLERKWPDPAKRKPGECTEHLEESNP